MSQCGRERESWKGKLAQPATPKAPYQLSRDKSQREREREVETEGAREILREKEVEGERRIDSVFM